MTRSVRIFCFASIALAALFGAGSCEMNDIVTTMQERLRQNFKSSRIYQRGNIPDDAVIDDNTEYYDIIQGAFRYVENQLRPNRNLSTVINRGDSIAFYFDAGIYNGSLDRHTTFYTNIETLIPFGDNPVDRTDFWSLDPLRIKVGDDPKILKSVQTALIGCMAGDGDPTNDEDGGIASDDVRIYLTPDLGFGKKGVYNVPRNSTLVFRITDIVIIEQP